MVLKALELGGFRGAVGLVAAGSSNALAYPAFGSSNTFMTDHMIDADNTAAASTPANGKP